MIQTDLGAPAPATVGPSLPRAVRFVRRLVLRATRAGVVPSDSLGAWRTWAALWPEHATPGDSLGALAGAVFWRETWSRNCLASAARIADACAVVVRSARAGQLELGALGVLGDAALEFRRERRRARR